MSQNSTSASDMGAFASPKRPNSDSDLQPPDRPSKLSRSRALREECGQVALFPAHDIEAEAAAMALVAAAPPPSPVRVSQVIDLTRLVDIVRPVLAVLKTCAMQQEDDARIQCLQTQVLEPMEAYVVESLSRADPLIRSHAFVKKICAWYLFKDFNGICENLSVFDTDDVNARSALVDSALAVFCGSRTSAVEDMAEHAAAKHTEVLAAVFPRIHRSVDATTYTYSPKSSVLQLLNLCCKAEEATAVARRLDWLECYNELMDLCVESFGVFMDSCVSFFL